MKNMLLLLLLNCCALLRGYDCGIGCRGLVSVWCDVRFFGNVGFRMGMRWWLLDLNFGLILWIDFLW